MDRFFLSDKPSVRGKAKTKTESVDAKLRNYEDYKLFKLHIFVQTPSTKFKLSTKICILLSK